MKRFQPRKISWHEARSSSGQPSLWRAKDSRLWIQIGEETWGRQFESGPGYQNHMFRFMRVFAVII